MRRTPRRGPPPASTRRARAGLAAAGLALAAIGAGALPGLAQTPARVAASPRVEAQRQADAALALLSVSVSPNRSANALFLDSSGGRPFELTAVQAGRGGTPEGWAPLYLEGFVAASSYDPSIIVGPGIKADARWRNLSATGGVGRSFPLTPNLTFRPIVNVAFGGVSAEADGLLPRPGRLPFQSSGDFFAWGLGASAMLTYAREFGEADVESELRLTAMRLQSFDRVFGVSASADAASVTSWTRVRVPTGYQAFGAPLRAVAELAGTWLPGDQGAALRSRWLAQVGGGLEVDLSAQDRVPWVSRFRVLGRVVVGEALTGVSVGVGLNF